MSTNKQQVETLVRAALKQQAVYGSMTAMNVRNVIENTMGVRLSIGQVRYALGQMKDLHRGRAPVVRFADGSRSEPMIYSLPGERAA